MGSMKKADVHKMYREDASAAIESMAIAGSGLEEVIATAMFSGLAVDLWLVSGEIEVVAPVGTQLWKAKDPDWQWALDHRTIVRSLLASIKTFKDYSVAGFQPFAWLNIFLPFNDRWHAQLGGITRLGKEDPARWKADALPMADRLLLASFVPSLLYALVRIIANVPRLAGDLLPG